MKGIGIQLVFFFKTLLGFSQPLPPQQVSLLPPQLQENSGMVVLSADSILFANDSGNPSTIFLIDTLGNILKETHIKGFSNVDWEELAYDGANRIFIGDFGNNNNTRQDLKIGVFNLEAVLQVDTIEALEIINFSYATQQSYPPNGSRMHYDLEAMISVGDSLYLFSKNRTQPFDGKVYQYTLPAKAGSYLLSPKDSFVTGLGLMASYWVTSAAYHAPKQELLLLGYDKLWRFTNATPPFFFLGSSVSSYAFNSFTQKECVDYVHDSLIYLSDEQSMFSSQSLYKVKLNTNSLALMEQEILPYQLGLNSGIANDSLFLQFTTNIKANLVYEIFSIEGKRVLFGKLGSYRSGKHQIEISLNNLAPGGYVLNVLVNNRPNGFRFSKPYHFKN